MKQLTLSNDEKSLKFEDNGRTDLGKIVSDTYSNIKYIQLRLHTAVVIDENNFTNFNSLVEIYINSESLQFIGFLCFRPLQRLQNLYLNTPNIAVVPYLKYNHHLRVVFLNIPNVIGLSYMFAGNRSLVRIDLEVSLITIRRNIFNTSSLRNVHSLTIINKYMISSVLEVNFFVKFESLQFLKLEGIKIIDTDVQRLGPHIRRLSLINCSIRYLGFLGKLEQLTELDLSKNKLFCAFDHLTFQPGVRYLNLSRNTFTYLQHILNNFQNLRHLDLSHCSIRHFKCDYLMKCALNLQYLILSFNLFASIGHSVFENCANLTHLSIDNNNLNYIDRTSLHTLANLTYLTLERNLLTDFEINIFATLINLETLNLSYNSLALFKIDYFNEKVTYKLKSLFLTLNDIFKIVHNDYATIYSFVETLHLAHNNIRNLNCLQLQNFGNLTDLNLNFNKIKRIYNDSFGNLRCLKTLLLKGNYISVIEDDAFEKLLNLNILNLENNRIEIVSGKLFRYNFYLTNINLDSNSIRVLSSDTFSGLCQLKYLNVSKNPIPPNDLVQLNVHHKFHIF